MPQISRSSTILPILGLTYLSGLVIILCQLKASVRTGNNTQLSEINYNSGSRYWRMVVLGITHTTFNYVFRGSCTLSPTHIFYTGNIFADLTKPYHVCRMGPPQTRTLSFTIFRGYLLTFFLSHCFVIELLIKCC